MTSEFASISKIAGMLPSAPSGEVWIGDDAAVVRIGGEAVLLAADTVVGGVHADLSLTTLDDLGWKAMAANISDLAAMGGEPRYALVTVAAPGGIDLEALYRGISAAAVRYRCPVVGGDLTNSDSLVITVAVTGTVDGAPVLRSGARAGNGIWVTGPLGGSSAGLRILRRYSGQQSASAAGPTSREKGGILSADPLRIGEDCDGSSPPDEEADRLGEVERALIAAHARPTPLVESGTAARRSGATAMIDVSDGFAADLAHIADASVTGFELDRLPVANGATRSEALGGGEDYQLVFTAPDDEAVLAAFSGLPEPVRVGVVVADPRIRLLEGEPMEPVGYEHDL